MQQVSEYGLLAQMLSLKSSQLASAFQNPNTSLDYIRSLQREVAELQAKLARF